KAARANSEHKDVAHLGTPPAWHVTTGHDASPAAAVVCGALAGLIDLHFAHWTAQASSLATATPRYPRSGQTVTRHPPGAAAA
ncbi:MAG TPA: hypothetical protein VIV12_22895, partial [Streptosporangiaceae bacterium]